MRLLFFIDCLGPGGAQRQMVTMAKGLLRRGHQIRFITYYPGGHFLSELESLNIPCSCMLKKGYFSRIREFRQIAQKGWQDVVLSFLEAPSLYAELGGLPFRRWGLVVGERSAHPLTNRGRRHWLRWVHRFADNIVTNSNTNRLMLEDSWPTLRKKLTTIYNAVDLVKFSPPPLNSVVGVDSSLRMVVAASYQRLKNMIGLARALHILVAQGKKIIVDWYGGLGSDEEAFREAESFVRKHGLSSILRFHPPIRHIEAELRRADVVGLFSYYEGLPNAVAEGMACGKAIVMSDVSDARNLVEDGKNGFLCNPSSTSSIAEALSKIMSVGADERLRMGAESRRRAEALFEPESCLTQYELILESARRSATSRSMYELNNLLTIPERHL